jgi:hypothetical protein
LEPIRILFMEMPRVLGEIVEALLAREDDMRPVGSVRVPAELLPEVDRTRAELVIWFLPDHELPQLCSELLDAYPRVKVLALEQDGRRGFIYRLLPQQLPLGEIWPERLSEAIRNAAGSWLAKS